MQRAVVAPQARAQTMPKKRLKQEERRSQIIRVAIDLFATRGFKGTTTRAIAEAAGVSEAIIFRHFATKEDLYDAIITHTVEKRQKLWESDQQDLPDRLDLETLLRSYAHSYIERNRDDASFLRLMMYSALQEHRFREQFLGVYRSPHIRAIRKAIQAGIDSGDYEPLDVRLTVMSFHGTLTQYCIRRFVARPRAEPRHPDDEMVEIIVALFLRGIIRRDAKGRADQV